MSNGTTHPDDQAVDRFAAAIKAKMAASRAKGRDGWDNPDLCSTEMLADMLIDHLGKGNEGNFLDVATIAMMLHERGDDPADLAAALERHDDRVRRVIRPPSYQPMIDNAATAAMQFRGRLKRAQRED